MKSTIIADDIDGPVNQAETIPFALDGITYEIDLNKQHRAELQQALSPFIKAGRCRSRPRRVRKSRAKVIDLKPSLTTEGRIDQEQAAAVRRWARDHGHRCSNKGRIPIRIMQDYQNYHRQSQREQQGTEAAPQVNSEAVVD